LLIGNGTTTSPTLVDGGGALNTNAGASVSASTLAGGGRTLSLGSALTSLPSPISGTPALVGGRVYWFGLK